MSESHSFDAEKHTEIPSERRILLEIGHGVRSLAAHSTLEFTNGDTYIGVELPEDNKGAYRQFESSQETLDFYRQEVKKKRAGESVSFISADARHLPLPEGSVQRVFMSNVVDSPLIGENPRAFDELFLSTRKVMKDDAEIVIHEDRTPVSDFEFKERIFKSLGFEITEVAHRGRDEKDAEAYEKLRRRYGMRMDAPLRFERNLEEVKKMLDISLHNPESAERLSSDGRGGDYFLILKKSKTPPVITPGKTETAHQTAINQIISEERHKCQEQYEKKRKAQLEREDYLLRQRREHQKKLAIQAGKAVIKGAGKLAKHLKNR